MVVDGILDLYETQMTEDADHRKRVYRQIIPELTLRESTRELNSE